MSMMFERLSLADSRLWGDAGSVAGAGKAAPVAAESTRPLRGTGEEGRLLPRVARKVRSLFALRNRRN
jgi:hypothetical protein